MAFLWIVPRSRSKELRLLEHVPAVVNSSVRRRQRARVLALVAVAARKVEVALEVALLRVHLGAPQDEPVGIEQPAKVDVCKDPRSWIRRAPARTGSARSPRADRWGRADRRRASSRPAAARGSSRRARARAAARGGASSPSRRGRRHPTGTAARTRRRSRTRRWPGARFLASSSSSGTMSTPITPWTSEAKPSASAPAPGADVERALVSAKVEELSETLARSRPLGGPGSQRSPGQSRQSACVRPPTRQRL